MQTAHPAALDLYWIPVGAGGHYVRFNGRVFEALAAARRHRARCDLYHVALAVELDGDRYTIELAPTPDDDAASRGVVATGAVGSRLAPRRPPSSPQPVSPSPAARCGTCTACGRRAPRTR